MTGVMCGDIPAFKDQNDILQRLASVQTPNELKEALAELADHIASEIERVPQSYSFIIHKSVKMIQEQYQNGVTLEELAHSFHITPEYLSSLFQKELGVSYTAYLKELRIKKAKELLLNERLKAFEVANRVGYSDAKYFSRVFKEATGLTPGEFQKLH
jgi:two-component system response regulator YesN